MRFQDDRHGHRTAAQARRYMLRKWAPEILVGRKSERQLGCVGAAEPGALCALCYPRPDDMKAVVRFGRIPLGTTVRLRLGGWACAFPAPDHLHPMISPPCRGAQNCVALGNAALRETDSRRSADLEGTQPIERR